MITLSRHRQAFSNLLRFLASLLEEQNVNIISQWQMGKVSRSNFHFSSFWIPVLAAMNTLPCMKRPLNSKHVKQHSVEIARGYFTHTATRFMSCSIQVLDISLIRDFMQTTVKLKEVLTMNFYYKFVVCM